VREGGGGLGPPIAWTRTRKGVFALEKSVTASETLVVKEGGLASKRNR